MEAFSLLKHSDPDNNVVSVSGAGSVSTYSSDEEEEEEDETYFDLQFAIPDEEEEKEQENGDETEDVSSLEEEAELKFSLTSNECTDQNVTISPSNELSSAALNDSAEENSKFPVSLLKSATKFRVLLLKLKKSKSEKSDEANGQEIVEETQKKSSKFFTVKLKVEEIKFPLVSLFTRDSSKNLDSNSVSDDRNLTKEVVQKYLKMVKPFYVRVSKRYVQKMKFSGQSSVSKGGAGVSTPPCEGSSEVVEPEPALESVKGHQKQGSNNRQTGLKVVRKHLGKSRSASAIVAADPPGKVASSRRDDSLLQVQDGIQGAILHCKRSFNTSRGPI